MPQNEKAALADESCTVGQRLTEEKVEVHFDDPCTEWDLKIL